MSNYDSILEEDSLEQLEDIGDFSEIDGLIDGFRMIERTSCADLIHSVLKKGKITQKKIDKLSDHFRDDTNIVDAIDKILKYLF